MKSTIRTNITIIPPSTPDTINIWSCSSIVWSQFFIFYQNLWRDFCVFFRMEKFSKIHTRNFKLRCCLPQNYPLNYTLLIKVNLSILRNPISHRLHCLFLIFILHFSHHKYWYLTKDRTGLNSCKNTKNITLFNIFHYPNQSFMDSKRIHLKCSGSLSSYNAGCQTDF